MFKQFKLNVLLSIIVCCAIAFCGTCVSAEEYQGTCSVQFNGQGQLTFPIMNGEDFLDSVSDYQMKLQMANNARQCAMQDVCMGIINNEHRFDYPYCFVSRDDREVKVRTMPWTDTYCGVDSPVIDTLLPGSMVFIDGILRNQHNNIWLHIVDSGYVYVDNVYYDYETNLLEFYQYVKYERYNTLIDFADCVREGAVADIKHWLDPSAKGIVYKVRTMYQGDIEMTAEEIGNMNYGSLGTLLGYHPDLLRYGGGAVNVMGDYGNPFELVNIIKECSQSYCDSSEDIEFVNKGIDYINNAIQ